MTDVNFDLEVANRQLTKDILKDLGIDKALSGKYTNNPAQASALIDEYGKYYKQLYKYINQPYDTK
jgi:hypothetical protein